MKKFKKSEIAIYAIALMLVTAGYFNYSTFKQETKETYSEDINGINEEYANVGDAVLVSNNEVENVENENTEKQENNNEAISSSSNITDSSLTNENNDYYVNAKLDREKMYAEMLANYEKIINNSNASEAQKSIATQEITKINNTKNAIMICENLIQTKGFEKCLILVNDSSINVIVHIIGGLNTENVAKIQNIVSRELNTEINNIHISEK